MSGASYGVLDDGEDFTATIIEPGPGGGAARGLFPRPDPRIDPRIERRHTPPGVAPGGQEILYAEDFDSPLEEPPAPPSAAPPALFSAADVEAARAAGREAGFAAAAEDQANLRAGLETTALQSLAAAVAATRHDAASIADTRAEALAGAMLAVLNAAVPALTAAHADVEVGAILTALLPGLRIEPVVRVRIHPDLENCLRAAWARMSQDEPAGELQLTADPSMPRGDVRLSWADGRATRDTAGIWDAIRSALAPFDMPSLQELVHGQ